MKTNHWVIILLILFCLPISSCNSNSGGVEKIQPVKLEPIEGSELKRTILTEKAAERIDLQTAPVRQEMVNGVARKVVPYAAVIYDLHGETWLYTNPAPLTFVRESILIDYIEGDRAILVNSPALGTQVVIVGVAELYGAETGVSK